MAATTRMYLYSLLLSVFLGAGLVCASGEEPVLNVYNWADYIAPGTIEKFEKETGITVNYDVYESDEVLESKLLLGGSGYDVVFPSANPFFSRQIKAGIYQPITRAKLKNYRNLDPVILKRIEDIDPGNTYGVPYFWGTTGIAYNAKKLAKFLTPQEIKEMVQSWGILFNPEKIKKIAPCGVALQSSPLDVFNAILAYLGFNPNTTSPEEFEKAVKILTDIRPHIKKFSGGSMIDDLATGETCIALAWSGDVMQANLRAQEINQNFEIQYAVPKEGAELAFDVMAIPKDAPHPDNAHKFIDFILRAQVIAEITNYVYYANPNKASLPYLLPEIRENVSVYPKPEVMKRLFVSKTAPTNFERWRSRMWIRIKTGI